MFKVKLTKKSSTNIASNNEIVETNKVKKRIQLNQNNDIINQLQKRTTERDIQINLSNGNNLINTGGLLRPRSGMNRNPSRVRDKVLSGHNQEDRLAQTGKIRNRNTTVQTLERPLTSSNAIGTKGQDKKQRLLNRRTTLNKNFNNLKTSSGIETQDRQLVDNEQQTNNNSYVSNSQAELIILQILQQSDEYIKLRQINSDQFQRIKQKLLSNTSIIVLKWYKILQDQLYNQVRNMRNEIDGSKQISRVPQSIEELIFEQIKRFFSKQNGLFKIQQRCSSQQTKLQNLIDMRLQKLQNMLNFSTVKVC